MAGFRFIVDQLNKLPFIDIQADLSATGGSFDAMAGQIENAGTMADTATPAVAGLAAATDAEKIAADKAKTATDLWAQAARENEAAVKPLTTVMATLSDEMDETYTATDSLGIIIGKTKPQVSQLTMEYIAQNKAIKPLTPVMGALTDEMDEAYTASNNLGIIIGASKGPTADLAKAVDDMKMEIGAAQKATDLHAAALKLLTPAEIAAAKELGLFGLAVGAAGSAAADGVNTITAALAGIPGSAVSSTTGVRGGTGYDVNSGRIDNADGTISFGPSPFNSLARSINTTNDCSDEAG